MADFDVTSTVKIDMPKLEKITAAAAKALEITPGLVLSEVKNAQVFPFKTGNLQNESTFVDEIHSSEGIVSIVSDTPYGRRLYYHPEYNFNREYNANARGEWYEDWLPGGQQEDFAAETFAKIFKEVSDL